MAGNKGRLDQEKILKVALLILSFIFIMTGIAIFAHGLIKTKILPRFVASEDSEEEEETSTEEKSTEETSTEETSTEESSTEILVSKEEGSDDSYIAANDMSAEESEGSDDSAEDTLDTDGLTEDERIAIEEEERLKAEEEAAASAEQKYSIDYIYGVFIASDVDIVRAFAPTIAFHKDNTFDLTLNFDDNMKTYTGTFTTSVKQDEMDDLSIYLKIKNPGNGIKDTATVIFSDSSDYCMFMDEGFGLMGYSGAPYYFNRDER